jgi:hypothetical protein
MKYKVGDNLRSQVNTIFSGYYKVIEVTETHYFLETYEDNGKKTFPNNNGKFGIYKKTKNWVEKNTYPTKGD